MAFEPNYKTINTSYRKGMGNDQQMVECKLQPEKGTTIGKILCTKVVACTQDTEVLNGNAMYNGKAKFEVVYSSEDGNLYNINDIVEFSGKINNPALMTGQYALASSEVVDSKIDSVREDLVVLSAIVDTNLDCIVNDEVQYIEEAGDDMIVRMDKMTYCTMKSAQKGKFKVMEEFEVKEDIGKLLMATVNTCINEVYSGTGYITIKGSMNVNLTYETAGEDKELKSMSKTIPFKEEIMAEGTMPEAFVNIIAFVRPDDVNVYGDNVDGSTILKVNADVCFNYTTMCKDEVDVVSDAFSMDNETNLVAESFNKCKFNVAKNYKERATSSVRMDDMDYQIESIAGDCGGEAFVVNSYCMPGYVMVEGICHANVVYYSMNDNEEMMYQSMAVEIPYSIEVPCEEATDNSEACVKVAVKDMMTKSRRRKEMEVDMDLCVYVDVWENEQDMMISHIDMKEMPMDDKPALRMYMIKEGSTLWDVCKYVCADPETIMEQNANLEFPLASDTMIIIYKQKEEII